MSIQSSITNTTYKAASLFTTILLAAAAIFVLLMLSIHFGWSSLAGLIFTLTGLATSALCFFANTIKAMFGKGRAVGLGIVSLYLSLMSTLTFAAPDFFAGLGINGWIALTTIFFTATMGGSVALISFEKASKAVSILIICFIGFGLISGHIFARGVQYIASNAASALGRSVYSVGAKLEDSEGDIRTKYQAEYQAKKAALEKEWESGKIAASVYEEKRRALDKEYERAFYSTKDPEIMPTATPAQAITPDISKVNLLESKVPLSEQPKPISAKLPGLQKSGKILLLLVEAIDGKTVENGAITQALTKRLVENSLSVTHGSEISSEIGRIRRELQRVQTGDLAAGESIPFAVIVTGAIQVNIPEPSEGVYYVAFADGTIEAITAGSGRKVAVEKVSRARGFGNTRSQAALDALSKASEKISESFIRQIFTNAR
jgi:hypothetical protein